MYLSDFYLERFGEYSRTGVEGLASGLNLIFEPSEDDRSPIVDFLRGMFGGFMSSPRHPVGSMMHGCGGLVGMETGYGWQTLSRYDNGRDEGGTRIERPDGTSVSSRALHELLGQLPQELISRAYFVDFQQAPCLDDLLSAVGGSEMARRHSRQRRLNLEQELIEGERRAASLHREIATLDRSLAELTDRRERLKSSLLNRTPAENAPDTPELEKIDAEMKHWKTALRDLIARQKALAEQCDALKSISRQADSAEPNLCSALIALDTQIEQMGKTVKQIGSNANEKVATAMTQDLGDMQDKLLEAGAALKLRHLDQRYRRKNAERRQLARCEMEMRHVLRLLVERRRTVIKRLSHANDPSPTSNPKGNSERRAGVDQPSPRTRTDRPTKSERRMIRELDREVERLKETRTQRIAELNQCELGLADRRAELADPGVLPALLENASPFMQRLTGGIWGNLFLDEQGELFIQRGAATVRFDRLDVGTRNQAYLATCLAVAEEQRRQGRNLPLVFNAPFTHFPSQQVRTALELLAEISRRQQIICISRHEHVTSVGRLLNIPIHSRRRYESLPARYRANKVSQPHEMCSGSDLRAEPRRIEHWNQTAAWINQELAGPLWGPFAPMEDMPRGPRAISQLDTVTRFLAGGESETASLRAESNAGVGQSAIPGSRRSAMGLDESDPIELAPSIDAINAERLRRVGLLRVGDLLRVPTEDIADDLRLTGVTSAMIESWRCQARLSCAIRGLRPYDARILVGCGIRTPEQLVAMQPAALRARVKEFASSAEGQAVLLSGTEFELSRVTDWINDAREWSDRGTVASSSNPEEAAEQPASTERRRGKSASRNGERTRRRQDVHEVRASTHPNPEYFLHESERLSMVPWIAESTVAELREAGIVTIGDLLGQTAESIAEKLLAGRITVDLVRQWQQQVALVCRVPRLRLDDARVLVLIGVTTLEQLAATAPKDLWQKVTSYCESDGRKLARTSDPPSKDEVSRWIAEARRVRVSNAA